MKYKNILIDMGNVIMDFSPDYILTNYTKDVKLINKLKYAVFLNDVWSKTDADLATEEDVYQNAISQVESEYHEMVREIVKNWYKHKTNSKQILEIIKEFKEKGYKIYLCSNAAKSFYDYEKDIEAFQYLDGKIISADIKLVKPSKEYFEYVLEKYNLKPEECFFIDDLIANVKGAYQCGIDGYWYNGNSQLLYRFLKSTNML